MTTSISATGIPTPAITSGLYNSGQLAGFRNKIINGNFSVNQMGYISGTATTAGQLIRDRWKISGTSGVTDSGGFVTVPNGHSISQTIEGTMQLRDAGLYTLYWEGTAQGRINGGAYGTSGNVSANLPALTNAVVEFTNGTVKKVQLLLGGYTPYEETDLTIDLARCRRYLWVLQLYDWFYDFYQAATAYQKYVFSTQQYMRVIPTAHLLGDSWTVTNTALVTLRGLSRDAFEIEIRANSAGRVYGTTASNTAILLSAEL